MFRIEPLVACSLAADNGLLIGPLDLTADLTVEPSVAILVDDERRMEATSFFLTYISHKKCIFIHAR